MRAKCRSLLALAGLVVMQSTALFAEDGPAHIDASGVNMQPAYPASAQPTREAGMVLLRVAVTADGEVSLIHLRGTSGYLDLDSAAIAAVMGWKFVPAMKDNRPVAGETNVQLSFQPPDTEASPASEIKLARPLIPPMLTILSGASTLSIPCANGGLATTMLLAHAGDIGSMGNDAAVSIVVRDNHDAAILSVTSQHGALDLVHGEAVESEEIFPASHIMAAGIFITWSQSGRVSATVGRQNHQVQLPASPTELSFVTANTPAIFWNSDVVCFPGQPHLVAH